MLTMHLLFIVFSNCYLINSFYFVDSNKASASVGEEAEHNNNKLTLYSYWRSSCSFRVRIALNLKGTHSISPTHYSCLFITNYIHSSIHSGLKFDYKPVNLLKGEQSHPGLFSLPYFIVLSILTLYFVNFVFKSSFRISPAQPCWFCTHSR